MQPVKFLFPEIFVVEVLKLDPEGQFAKYVIELTNGVQPWINFNQLDFELATLCFDYVDIGYREADGEVLNCTQHVNGKEIWSTLERYRVFNNDHNLVWCPNLMHIKQLHKEWELVRTRKPKSGEGGIITKRETYPKEFVTEFLQLTEDLDNHLSEHILRMQISSGSLNPWSVGPLPLNSTSITMLKFDVTVAHTDSYTKGILFLDENHNLTLKEARGNFSLHCASHEDGRFMWRPNANSLLKLYDIWSTQPKIPTKSGETKMKESKPLFPVKFIIEALHIQAGDQLYGYLVSMKPFPDSLTSWLVGDMKNCHIGEILKFDVGTKHLNNENVFDCKYAVTFEEIQRYYSHHTGIDLQGQVVWRPNRDSLVVSYHEWVAALIPDPEQIPNPDDKVETPWLKSLEEKILGVSAHSINAGIGFGIGVGKSVAKQMIEEAATNMKAAVESVDLKKIFSGDVSRPDKDTAPRSPKIGDFIVFEYDGVVRRGYIDAVSETHYYVNSDSKILKVSKDNGDKMLFGEWDFETPSDMFISIVDRWYKDQEAVGKELSLADKFFSTLFKSMFWDKK